MPTGLIMYQLGFYLEAHNAAVILTPGKIELKHAGRKVCIVNDDEYHSVFQAVDQYFCERYDFLTRTSIEQLVSKRQIIFDLDAQDGRVPFQFRDAALKATAYASSISAEPPATRLPTTVTNERLAQKTVNPESPILKTDIEGLEDMAAKKMVEEMQLIFTNASSFSDGPAELRAFDKFGSKLQCTIGEAAKMVHSRWYQVPTRREVSKINKYGFTEDLLNDEIVCAVLENLPDEPLTASQCVRAVVDVLKTNENKINCDNKSFRLGPYGAATLILQLNKFVIRRGRYFHKKITRAVNY